MVEIAAAPICTHIDMAVLRPRPISHFLPEIDDPCHNKLDNNPRVIASFAFIEGQAVDALTIIGIIGIIIGIVAGIVQIIDYLQKQREQRALTTPNKPLPAAATQTDDTPSHLASLRQQLTNLFNESELRNLYFDLGVDYESLPARSKDGKARELIAHMQRNSRLSELITMGRQLRPQAPWPDLPHEPTPDPFPKLTIPHNLPRRSPFVGREAEKAQVHEALLADGYLVSIEGIGGIGKSSLALQVAHECLQAGLAGREAKDIATFEGLIWVTAKDQELNLDGLLNTIARTLEYVGIAQQPLEEKQVAVQKLLRAKRCLLILDNYETVIDAGVHQFTLELPEPSKVLITTRTQNTPQAHIISLHGMTQTEALTLMRTDGQRLGLPAIAQADEAVLVRLYEATGGAPLALKWALGQIKQKGQSLDIVLTALHEARGTIFEAMFARAWELLSDESRRVLLVMPIFATSADRPDIEYASAIQGLAIDEALGQLVEMTLVEATGDIEITSRRYSIHPLTRAFAQTRLTNNQSLEEESRLRLANFYIRKGQEIGQWGSIAGFPWFESELPNILTLLDWANEVQVWEVVTSLFEPVVYFLGTKGYWQERVKYGWIALEAARRNNNQEYMAYFQHTLGWILYRQGQYLEAKTVFESSVQQYLELGKNRDASTVMVNWARMLIVQGNVDEASDLVDTAIKITQEDDHYALSPSVLTIRGMIAGKLGNYDEARDLLGKALEASEKQGKIANSCSRQRDLGFVAIAQDRFEDAARFFKESLESSRQIQRQDNIAKAKLGLARVHARQGEKIEAAKYAQSAKKLFQQMLMVNELREVEQLLLELGESEPENGETRIVN